MSCRGGSFQLVSSTVYRVVDRCRAVCRMSCGRAVTVTVGEQAVLFLLSIGSWSKPLLSKKTPALWLLLRHSAARPYHFPACVDLSMFVSLVPFLGSFLLQRCVSVSLVSAMQHDYRVHTKNANFTYLNCLLIWSAVHLALWRRLCINPLADSKQPESRGGPIHL